MVEARGVEPLTYSLQSYRSTSWAMPPGKINIEFGCGLIARLKSEQKLNCALSFQIWWAWLAFACQVLTAWPLLVLAIDLCTVLFRAFLLRKEVIQPQVPLRLPCYDFIPVTTHTLGGWPLAVITPTLGTNNFHDVTGGVYKARERIHGAVADAPLLAIPASCRRVAACNPNWAQF